MTHFGDDSLHECVVNTSEDVTHFETIFDHIMTLLLAKYQQFCPFSPLIAPLTPPLSSPLLPPPSLFSLPSLQQSLSRPCFANFSSVWNKTGSETREKGETVKWVGRKEEEMDAKQAERRSKRGRQGGPSAGRRGARLAS